MTPVLLEQREFQAAAQEQVLPRGGRWERVLTQAAAQEPVLPRCERQERVLTQAAALELDASQVLSQEQGA